LDYSLLAKNDNLKSFYIFKNSYALFNKRLQGNRQKYIKASYYSIYVQFRHKVVVRDRKYTTATLAAPTG